MKAFEGFKLKLGNRFSETVVGASDVWSRRGSAGLPIQKDASCIVRPLSARLNGEICDIPSKTDTFYYITYIYISKRIIHHC